MTLRAAIEKKVESAAPGDFMHELLQECERRQDADNAIRNDLSGLKTDISALREDVAKITLGMRGGKVFLGLLVTISASFGPEIVRICANLLQAARHAAGF